MDILRRGTPQSSTLINMHALKYFHTGLQGSSQYFADCHKVFKWKLIGDEYGFITQPTCIKILILLKL